MADDATGELGELLMRVARNQRRRWREALAPWDLSPHQARALRVVVERDGVRLSDLAESLHIAPRSATEVADGLQARGLVERTPDPADRRAWRLHVTAKAQPVVGKLRAIADDMTAEAFAGIDPKDIETTRRVLAQVRERAGQHAVMGKAANQ